MELVVLCYAHFYEWKIESCFKTVCSSNYKYGAFPLHGGGLGWGPSRKGKHCNPPASVKLSKASQAATTSLFMEVRDKLLLSDSSVLLGGGTDFSKT